MTTSIQLSVAGDNFINSTETGGAFVLVTGVLDSAFTGNQVGGRVNIIVNGNQFNVPASAYTADGDGNPLTFLASVPRGNFGAGGDGTSINVTARILQANGSLASPSAISTRSATFDLTADGGAPVTFTADDPDNVINADQDQAVAYTFGGPGLDGDFSGPASSTPPSTVTFTDSLGATRLFNLVVGSSTYDLSGLADGAVTSSLAVRDTRGNTTARTGDTITLDTTADAGGDLAVLIDDIVINDSEDEAVGFTVSGLDVDATATVTFSDGDAMTADVVVTGIGTNGAQARVDLSSLSDGTITATITATDASSNPATGASDTAILDTMGPAFTSPLMFTVDENQTSAGDVDATDPNGVTYSITGGDDAAAIMINTTTGELTFVMAPDAESPSDADLDGDYEVEVTATDDEGQANTQNVTVLVASVDDDPTVVMMIPDQSTAEDQVYTYDASTAFDDVDTADTLTYSLAGGGTVFTINTATGVITGTPGNNDVGLFTLTVTASDGSGPTASDTFDLTVTDVNDDPVATDDSYTVAEDGSLSGQNVLDNDTDVDSPMLTATLVDDVDNGTLVLNANGTFTYTPDANFDGTDTFTYTADDGEGGASNTATVTIDVTAIDDDPTVVMMIPDQSTAEDQVYTYDASTAFDDVDTADTLTYSLAGGGTVFTINTATGVITGTPGNDDVGLFTLTVTASDGSGPTASDTFDLTVTDVNDDPVATDDSYTVAEDGSLSGQNVLDNDTDVDSPMLTATLVDDVDNGTLVLNANGTFTYTPDANFDGTDTFTYTADDGEGGASNTATVTIDVTAIDDDPTVVMMIPDQSTAEDQVYTYDASTAFDDVDTADTLTYSLAGGGTVFTINTATGVITGTPGNNDVGLFTLTVTASDGSGPTASDTFDLTVTDVNDDPVATDDSYTVAEDGSLSGQNVLDNDTDVDSPMLTATLVDDVDNGTLVLNANGTFTYTPDANFDGTDTFTYTADDGEGGASNTATVTIDVTAIDDDPTVVMMIPDQSTAEDQVYTYDASTAFDDVDTADTLTYSLAGGGTVFTINTATGVITGTPGNNDVGLFTLTVTASDGSGPTASDTFDLTVTDVNDDPVATDDSYTVAEDGSLSGQNVLDNDTDVDSPMLTATLVDDVDNGTLVLNANGTFTYTPDANFDGTDTFTYTADDGEGGASNTATVTIDVTAIDDDPDIVTTNLNAAENQTAAGMVMATDPDGDPVMFSLGSGLDTALFTIAMDGTLTFNSAPDFENPSDLDGDNVYRVNVVVSDGSAPDATETITVTVTDVNETFVGTNGANTINGTSGGDNISGLGGNDSLSGGAGDDTLSGGSGNDTLDGGAGADFMSGGTGNDLFIVDDVDDAVFETANQGTDTVETSANFTLTGNGVEILTATADSLTLTGNDANNTITSRNGINRLNGNAGNDSLTGGSGEDRIDGGVGVDTMAGGESGDSYFVNDAADVVIESSSASGNDFLTTTVSYTLGANVAVENFRADSANLGLALTGNDFLNRITGGGGNDTLTGAGGDDRLTGGRGADVFDFNAVGETGPTGATRDTIFDFSRFEDDKIDLSTIDAVGSSTMTNEDFTFIGMVAFTGSGSGMTAVGGVAGQLRYQSATTNGVTTLTLQGDVNGDRVADFSIGVRGTADLVGTDFLL